MLCSSSKTNDETLTNDEIQGIVFVKEEQAGYSMYRLNLFFLSYFVPMQNNRLKYTRDGNYPVLSCHFLLMFQALHVVDFK